MSIVVRLLVAGLVMILAAVGQAGEKKADGKKSAAKSDRTLAENTLKTADADKNGSLDEDELREARRVLRSALQASIRGKVDAKTKLADKITGLAGEGKPDVNKDGKVTQDEFAAFVKSIMEKRDEMLKDAQKQEAEDRQQAKEDARNKAKIQELERKLQQERENDRRRRRR